MSPPWTPDRFEELFRSSAPVVRRYLRRHVEPDAVDDVLAETFALAWRRLDRVPEAPLPWLLVVARNMTHRYRRSRRRAEALWFEAVRTDWHRPQASPEDGVLRRDDALVAFEQCSDLEREALLLIAWDGLSHTDAARVAGCSTRAFTVRLSRARARFDRALAAEEAADDRSATARLLALLEQP
ncbi:RNA polymerase sigma factor [Arthrobacter sp. NEB 688]|uniref:RNA polymerase sigma factor n=1 Tax=Arthrobacter sp. NEB 688 TaxID=904039 RepID=UPI001564E107|nr:RNA polymerase sigma factor [Arthrobacter sp. NEB 688]QKE82516.1 RNA polymerase sigma factor [Arthrobacter sp. NEB 688]